MIPHLHHTFQTASREVFSILRNSFFPNNESAIRCQLGMAMIPNRDHCPVA